MPHVCIHAIKIHKDIKKGKGVFGGGGGVGRPMDKAHLHKQNFYMIDKPIL